MIDQVQLVFNSATHDLFLVVAHIETLVFYYNAIMVPVSIVKTDLVLLGWGAAAGPRQEAAEPPAQAQAQALAQALAPVLQTCSCPAPEYTLSGPEACRNKRKFWHGCTEVEIPGPESSNVRTTILRSPSNLVRSRVPIGK